jgi:cyanate permease
MTRRPAPLAFTPSDHGYRWIILGGAWLIYFSFGVTIAAIPPLVQPILRDLGMSHSAMGAVLGAWPLVYIAVAIPCGALLDRAGPRRTLFLAALIIAGSGLLRALAGSETTLFLAVAVFGFGGPLVSIGGPKLISIWFDDRDRGFAMGLYVTGPALGAIAALALTNSVMMPLMNDDWRRVLQAYAALSFVIGFVWLAVATHPAARAVERHLAAEPKRPQLQVFSHLLRLRPVQIVLLMSVGIFFFNHALNNWLPEILRTGGMDAATAGYWASIPTLAGVVGALVIPRFATPARQPAILLALFLCAGLASVLLHAPAGPVLATALILQGTARGTMMSLAILVLVSTRGVSKENIGAAGGLFFSAAEIGGVTGPLTVGAIYDLTGGFTASLVMLTSVCGMLLLLLAWFKRSSHRRD